MNNITVIKSLKEIPWGWFAAVWASDIDAAHKVPNVAYGFYFPENHTLYFCPVAVK